MTPRHADLEAGLTSIDLVVASGLLALLVPVLVLVLAVSDTALVATQAQVEAEAGARRILQGIARDIRSARPLGWCPTAPPGQEYSTAATECRHISQYTGAPAGARVPGGPLIYADSTDIWFWDDGSAGVLAVPDCVHVAVTPMSDVVVDRWSGQGTYTNALCPGVTFAGTAAPETSGTPAVRRYVGRLSGSRSIFTMPDPSLIRIAPTFEFRDGMATRAEVTFSVVIDATVRGEAYAREQAWNANAA